MKFFIVSYMYKIGVQTTYQSHGRVLYTLYICFFFAYNTNVRASHCVVHLCKPLFCYLSSNGMNVEMTCKYVSFFFPLILTSLFFTLFTIINNILAYKSSVTITPSPSCTHENNKLHWNVIFEICFFFLLKEHNKFIFSCDSRLHVYIRIVYLRIIGSVDV